MRKVLKRAAAAAVKAMTPTKPEYGILEMLVWDSEGALWYIHPQSFENNANQFVIGPGSDNRKRAAQRMLASLERYHKPHLDYLLVPSKTKPGTYFVLWFPTRLEFVSDPNSFDPHRQQVEGGQKYAGHSGEELRAIAKVTHDKFIMSLHPRMQA